MAHSSVGSYGKKSLITPPGIDPETVRLVAKCLNHYATAGPRCRSISSNYTTKTSFRISLHLSFTNDSTIIGSIIQENDRIFEVLNKHPSQYKHIITSSHVMKFMYVDASVNNQKVIPI